MDAVETVLETPTETLPITPTRSRGLKSPKPAPSSSHAASFQAAYEAAKQEPSESPATPASSEPAPVAATTSETPATVTPSEPTPPGADQTIPPPDDGPTLLSDQEFSALQTEHQDDPIALRRALEKRFNKAFTPKMQRLSALTKAIEPYADVLDGLESEDPAVRVATAKALATKYGVMLDPAAPVSSVMKEPSADALSIAREALGPEMEFLAAPFAKAMERYVDVRAKSDLDPIKSQVQDAQRRHAEAEVSQSMASFEKAHPDWKQHEPKMLELAQKFPPAGQVSEAEWMESLYFLATRQASIAAEVQRKIQTMTKAAKSSDDSRPAASESHVIRRPPKNAGFRSAYDAAKQGVRWE